MRTLMRLLAAATVVVVAPRVAVAQVSSGALPADSVATALRALSLSADGVALNGRYVRGDVTVEPGDTVHGPLVTVNGNALVRGVVAGNVYAIFGDVTLRDGADVLGGVSAWRGRVIIEGGRVRGAMHARAVTDAAAPAAPPMSASRALALAAGWTGMLLLVGLLVLVMASENLDATARALQKDFGRSFLAGVVGQLAFLPLLLLAVVALAVTVIGVLLIPFALVIAPVALAGLVTLGLLAVALLTGRGLRRGVSDPSGRGAMLSALVPGIVVLMAPWLVAAALQGGGAVGLVARTVAFAIIWVAGSAGLGAAILSRAGTGRAPRRPSAETQAAPAGWQTPTPVAGVATARRTVPARPEQRL